MAKTPLTSPEYFKALNDWGCQSGAEGIDAAVALSADSQ